MSEQRFKSMVDAGLISVRLLPLIIPVAARPLDVVTWPWTSRPRSSSPVPATRWRRSRSIPSGRPCGMSNLRSIEWKTEPPLAVGSRIAFVAEFLRRRLAYVYEVVEHVPGERFVMRTTEGPFPMETTYPGATPASIARR